MKKSEKKSRFGWEDIRDFCETLTEAEDALTRDMVSRIMDQVDGISQKSLTKTLRGLERDGLVTREVFAEVPPRVEYTITALGSEMLDHVAPLWLWVAKSVQSFQDCRAAFDRRELRPENAGLPLGMNGAVASLRAKRSAL